MQARLPQKTPGSQAIHAAKQVSQAICNSSSIDNILLQGDCKGARTEPWDGFTSQHAAVHGKIDLHSKTAQFASDCLYSWSTSINLDIRQKSRAVLARRCDLCLMSKEVAGPGALLEGQGTGIGSTGRCSAYVYERVTKVALPY